MTQKVKARRWLRFYAIGYIAFLYAPILIILLFSFNKGIYIVFPLTGLTLDWYGALFQNVEMIAALRNSLLVAFFVSLFSTSLGLLCAKALTHYQFQGKQLVATLIAAPLVVPALILGIGLLVIARQVLDISLSLLTVAMGHVLICLPFSVFALTSRLEGFDRSLEEASRDLGVKPWPTFWRITVPLALPGIIASLLLCFTVSFDEFMLSFFLTGNQTTLPVYVFSQLRFPDKLPSVLALGSCILIFSACIVSAAEFIRQYGFRPVKAAT